jgi:hypothetical protein
MSTEWTGFIATSERLPEPFVGVLAQVPFCEPTIMMVDDRGRWWMLLEGAAIPEGAAPVAWMAVLDLGTQP